MPAPNETIVRDLSRDDPAVTVCHPPYTHLVKYDKSGANRTKTLGGSLMGSVTNIRARAAAISDPPHRAHRGHRCECAGEVEALRAKVAELRAVVERQSEGGAGVDLAVVGIAFNAGRDSFRRSLGLPVR